MAEESRLLSEGAMGTFLTFSSCCGVMVKSTGVSMIFSVVYIIQNNPQPPGTTHTHTHGLDQIEIESAISRESARARSNIRELRR